MSSSWCSCPPCPGCLAALALLQGRAPRCAGSFLSQKYLLVIFHFSPPHFKEEPTQLASKGTNRVFYKAHVNKRSAPSYLDLPASDFYLSV